MECFALLDDCNASADEPSSRLYTGFVREHCCRDPDALEDVWAAADRDLRAGRHAVILADYEWGVRLQGAGGRAPAGGGALRVLVFDSLARLSAEQVDAWLAAQEAAMPGDAAGIRGLRPSVGREDFAAAIARIHAAIGEGETYQVNYTYRLDFEAFGLPVSLYRQLRARQPVSYGAFIALPPGSETSHILSCSPELFLRHRGGRLLARPMKGTACRAAVPEGDSEIARLLAGDAKNRAENLMIVDLLRNDLGRIAVTGSVRVPALFSVESHATVFQMTSDVEAELPAAAGFPDILRALFPCGSITGAPKHRTMQLIAELETTPRGLYTGCIGWIEAPGAGRPAACGDFCLSVAIRTVTLGEGEGGPRPGRMGVGAGIVIDSRAAGEFEECALKARFLTALDLGNPPAGRHPAGRKAGLRPIPTPGPARTATRRLALFDLDHTLIPFDSGMAWLRFLASRGAVAAEMPERYLERCRRYLAGALPLAELHRFAMAPLAWHGPAELAAWREAFAAEMDSAIPLSAHALVNRHRAAGALCCIVTATNDFVAAPFARALGVALLASAAERRGGRFTGEIAGGLCHGAAKVRRVTAWLDELGLDWGGFEHSVFYSDSASDLPLFERVAEPVAVAPDLVLRRMAARSGWRIADDLGATLRAEAA